MGVSTNGIGLDRMVGVRVLRTAGILALLALAAGCQTQSTVSNRRLIEHQALVDFSGLKSTQSYDALKATLSPPRQWTPLALQNTALFTHQQWKSPSGNTGAGVVYAHLPFPLSPRTLLWFAKMEYSKKSDGGRQVGEWTDDLGRPWFEAENNKYHVRGYAVTDGCSAWIVYFGYKMSRPPNPSELSLAARCIETVIPETGDQPHGTEKLVNAGK